MLEDTLDPRPKLEEFAQHLAAGMPAAADRNAMEAWLRSWNDRESIWANLGNIRHWIERART